MRGLPPFVAVLPFHTTRHFYPFSYLCRYLHTAFTTVYGVYTFPYGSTDYGYTVPGYALPPLRLPCSCIHTVVVVTLLTVGYTCLYRLFTTVPFMLTFAVYLHLRLLPLPFGVGCACRLVVGCPLRAVRTVTFGYRLLHVGWLVFTLPTHTLRLVGYYRTVYTHLWLCRFGLRSIHGWLYCVMPHTHARLPGYVCVTHTRFDTERTQRLAVAIYFAVTFAVYVTVGWRLLVWLLHHHHTRLPVRFIYTFTFGWFAVAGLQLPLDYTTVALLCQHVAGFYATRLGSGYPLRLRVGYGYSYVRLNARYGWLRSFTLLVTVYLCFAVHCGYTTRYYAGLRLVAPRALRLVPVAVLRYRPARTLLVLYTFYAYYTRAPMFPFGFFCPHVYTVAGWVTLR